MDYYVVVEHLDLRKNVLITDLLNYDKLYGDNRVVFVYRCKDGALNYKMVNYKDCVLYAREVKE